jgi:hypothetical protein
MPVSISPRMTIEEERRSEFDLERQEEDKLTFDHSANAFFPPGAIAVQEGATETDAFGTQAEGFENVCSTSDTSVDVDLFLSDQIGAFVAEFVKDSHRGGRARERT